MLVCRIFKSLIKLDIKYLFKIRELLILNFMKVLIYDWGEDCFLVKIIQLKEVWVLIIIFGFQKYFFRWKSNDLVWNDLFQFDKG